jgi:hypothetical protein
MNVYILSVYEEHGAEEVNVTLCREKLPMMLERYLKDCDDPEAAKARATLAELLAEPDESLTRPCGVGYGAQSVGDGWGTVQLHVVPLYEGE